jgi:formylglycine-generating enzyme required for sulfatase activity
VKLPLPPLLLLSGISLTSTGLEADDRPDRAALLKTFAAEFVPITPGRGEFPTSFTMGRDDGPENERPAHEVTIGYEFAVAKYEVPQNLYEAVLGSNPSKWKGPRNSVEMMSHGHAVGFCTRATELMREAKLISDDEEIRLPTEAEWEYVARAGTTTVYSFGDEPRKQGDAGNEASLLDKYAWHTANAAGNDPPVGALAPNAWGLCDVHGYLWEFTADEWADDLSRSPRDGSAHATRDDPVKKTHVLRGGSWKDRYDRLTSTARRKHEPNTTDDAVGFRCVKAKVRREAA